MPRGGVWFRSGTRPPEFSANRVACTHVRGKPPHHAIEEIGLMRHGVRQLTMIFTGIRDLRLLRNVSEVLLNFSVPFVQFDNFGNVESVLLPDEENVFDYSSTEFREFA